MDDAPTKTEKKPTFQEAFQAALDDWSNEGCPAMVLPSRNAAKEEPCGCKPKYATHLPNHQVSVACEAQHKSWTFDGTPYVEALKEEAREEGEVKDAPMGDGRNPLIATITITYDLRTQAVAFDPFIPSPLIGLGMLDAARKSIYDQMEDATKVRRDGLVVPEPKALLDSKGRPLS